MLAIVRGEDLLPPRGKEPPVNEPIDTPGLISALGQAIANQANNLANEAARPTLVDAAGLRTMISGLRDDLDRMDDALEDVLTRLDKERKQP